MEVTIYGNRPVSKGLKTTRWVVISENNNFFELVTSNVHEYNPGDRVTVLDSDLVMTTQRHLNLVAPQVSRNVTSTSVANESNIQGLFDQLYNAIGLA